MRQRIWSGCGWHGSRDSTVFAAEIWGQEQFLVAIRCDPQRLGVGEDYRQGQHLEGHPPHLRPRQIQLHVRGSSQRAAVEGSPALGRSLHEGKHVQETEFNWACGRMGADCGVGLR